jgi:hypothetical protein
MNYILQHYRAATSPKSLKFPESLVAELKESVEDGDAFPVNKGPRAQAPVGTPDDSLASHAYP